MKKKINFIIGIFFTIIMIFNSVKADDVIEQKTYNLEDAGINISIDSNMFEIITGLENNDEKLDFITSKEEYLASYKSSGILLDAVDSLESDRTKEILVIQNKNMAYRDIPDLNKLTEDDLKQYYEKFIESVKEQAGTTSIEVVSDELYKTENGNVYFHIISSGKTEDEETMNLSTYYTVMNQRLITIGIRYFNIDVDSANDAKILENITFKELPREDTSQEILGKTAIAVIVTLIIIAIAFFIIRRRDSKQIDKNLNDKEIKRFSKFGGILGIFWLINLYQIVLRILDIKNVLALESLKEYKVLIILQSVLMIILNAYLVYILLKKNKNTPNKAKRANIISLIVTIVFCVLRMIAGVISNNDVYTSDYYMGEVSYMISTAMYTLLWTIYLSVSQRVKIYYKISETIENMNIRKSFEKLKEKVNEKVKKVKSKKNKSENNESQKNRNEKNKSEKYKKQ